MQTARRQTIAPLALLALILTVASCSGSGGSGTSSADGSSPAAQATPAVPDTATAAKDHEAEQPATETVEAAPDAPELRPENATGAVLGVPAPTNTAPIVAVANYYTELPGIDIAGLKKGQKEKFLQRVNSEICSCGCKDDTLARCYVNDPRCPTVKSLVQKIYDEVKTGR